MLYAQLMLEVPLKLASVVGANGAGTDLILSDMRRDIDL